MRILACSVMLLAVGCTRSNAAFGELDETGTGGSDEGTSVNETTPLEDGTFGTGTAETSDSLGTGETDATSNGDSDATESSDESDESDSSDGSDSTGDPLECSFPAFDPFSVEFAVPETNAPFVGNCVEPIDLRGQLVPNQEATNEFQIRLCGDSCECGEEFELVDVRMSTNPGVQLPSCVRVVAEYLAGETCEFSGFALSNDALDGPPLVLAGHGVKALPSIAGGHALGMVEPLLCECETCNEAAGEYSLEFPSGDVVPERQIVESELFEGGDVIYSIHNIASHVDEVGDVWISWVAHR